MPIKTVTYGLYPQKHISDPDLLNSLSFLDFLVSPDARGWYFLDGEYYAKRTENEDREDEQIEFDDGVFIVSTGESFWFRCDPINWNVLSHSDEETLILSSLCLDSHRYSESYRGLKDGHYASNYKESEIRHWLNSDFLNSAFSLGDGAIQTTLVDNSGASSGDV